MDRLFKDGKKGKSYHWSFILDLFFSLELAWYLINRFVIVFRLAMMKEGGKATLIIPSDLAYGDAGSGGAVPPGATLKFEVELFKVNP